ncbi:Lysophosphatidylcholine acyltransferase [Echinococcus granulosus]|uniref:Lysophosphatidylcholine acyltransferase n=1 Tax=Echinococcus granulosus TaxID=6210 RepID=W6U376_ECHGR|nr:Lysophosphatidylcholine acyltransferase [Echinococcus granulosus]EUB54996.1 Lysophosphatidylcholine acyltransferase [Echinococcus granulosus]
MDELDRALCDETSFHDTALKNPFVHSIHISPARRVQLWLFAVFVFPFRLIFMLTFLFLTLFFGELATRRMDFSKPMAGFRKHILLPAFIFCGRMLFYSGGFIWVGHKGRRASCEEAPILVLAPHSSFYDSLVFLSLGMPSVVGKTETALSPIGSFIKMTQPILVNRDDPSSRQNTLAEIRHRALSNGMWPQVLIFPEGTCTNRSCLINYKQGAWNLCHGFAANLAANLPTTELSFDDCHRIRKAIQFNLPMACHINEYGKLTKYLFREPRSEGQISTSQVAYVTERLLSMAQAAREWYATTMVAGCSEALTPSKLAYIFLPSGCEATRDTPRDKVTLLRKVVATLPKASNGHPDIRILVVHLCFLMFSSSPSVAMQLAFQVFDTTTTNCASTAVPIGDGGCDGTDNFASRSISADDAVRLLTASYHLSTEEVTALLPSGGTKEGSHHPDVITPDYLAQAMSSHHPKLVSIYEDYKNELIRLRGQSERAISETSSTSNSICSLYSSSTEEVDFKPGHRREASNTSVASSTVSLEQAAETDLRNRVATPLTNRDL